MKDEYHSVAFYCVLVPYLPGMVPVHGMTDFGIATLVDNRITVATMFLGLLSTNTEFMGKGACVMMVWLLFLGVAIVVIVASLSCPCFGARAPVPSLYGYKSEDLCHG